jgi:hypothetical protein
MKKEELVTVDDDFIRNLLQELLRTESPISRTENTNAV